MMVLRVLYGTSLHILVLLITFLANRFVSICFTHFIHFQYLPSIYFFLFQESISQKILETTARKKSHCRASMVILRCYSCYSYERSNRRVHSRIKRTRKFHSVSGGIVRSSAAETPSARTPPEFQAVIVQTQFLYTCIKDCVWTSLLGISDDAGEPVR